MKDLKRAREVGFDKSSTGISYPFQFPVILLRGICQWVQTLMITVPEGMLILLRVLDDSPKHGEFNRTDFSLKRYDPK
jgi:hypothetical protein